MAHQGGKEACRHVRMVKRVDVPRREQKVCIDLIAGGRDPQHQVQ